MCLGSEGGPVSWVGERKAGYSPTWGAPWDGMENALAGPCQLRRRAGWEGGETDPCSVSVTVKDH